jgi:hypothetical protein
MAVDGKETYEEFKQLQDQRQSWDAEYQDITRYILPRRSIWKDLKGRTEPVGTDIYDGTAPSACRLMANGLVGHMVSPSQAFMRLRLPTTIPGSNITMEDLPGAGIWLEMGEKAVYEALRSANFYNEILEIFADGGAVGQGTLSVQYDELNRVHVFNAHHPKEIFFSTDRHGKVDVVHRRWFPKVRELAEQFGEKRLSENAREILERSSNDRVEVIHCVKRRSTRKYGAVDQKNKPWASYYYETGISSTSSGRRGGEQIVHILAEGGFDRNPYIVWRFSTNSDEEYGRGPGNDVLSQVKLSNNMAKTLMEAAHLAVNPPLNVPDTMRDRLDLRPFGKNITDGVGKIEPINVLSRQYPIGIDRESKVQKTIEDAFMVSLFLMLDRAPKGMTATEVLERSGEKAAVLGPVVSRISSELLDPTIDTVFANLMEAGVIQPPPQQLTNVAQALGMKRIDTEYIGPLAQQQRKFHVTQGALQSLDALAPVFQMFPSARDNFDGDSLSRELALGNGMPSRAMRAPEHVAEMRKLRSEQAETVQRKENAERDADAFQKTTKAPEPGSPAYELAQAQAEGRIPAQPAGAA